MSLNCFLIMHNNFFNKCEDHLECTDFSFRNAVGTKEAVFSDDHFKYYLLECCIDYQNAFDSVQHGTLCEISARVDFVNRDIRIISNLYWNQTASIPFEVENSEDIQIKRDVG